jgi:hypothetical protein
VCGAPHRCAEPSDARRDARELGGHRRGCRHGRQSSGAARRRAGKLDARWDATQSATAAQMRCGEFVSASVAGSVQLERLG